MVATYPSAGQGLECGLDSPPECGVPRDAKIEFRFDRFLLPSTAVRQAFRIYTGSEDLSFTTQPEYDLVERVVTFSLPNGALFQPGVRYSVELFVPASDDAGGFRAFDDAPLAEGDVPLTFDFRTQQIEPPAAPPDPAPWTCDQVVDVFGGSTPAWSAGTCHSGRNARMGLRLESRAALIQTAIGEVAHQTMVGSKASAVLSNPPRMGVQMARIHAGQPENSYLLYKLIRNPNIYRDPSGVGCTTVHEVPLPAGTCPEPSEEESQRLADYFVRGLPMPRNSHVVDVRGLQRWIKSGAPCAE